MRASDRVVRPLLLCILGLMLAGCSAGTEAAPPTPTTPPTPLPTPTVEFAVAISPLPTRPYVHRHVVPTATRFVAPNGPYLLLVPSSGPPISRTIRVVAGHLPASRQVALVWAPGGKVSSLQTTSYTDKAGSLHSQFAVPATSPGIYRLLLQVDGLTYVRAEYRVRSRATMVVEVSPDSAGDRISVAGKRFLPHTRLALIAYPLFKGQKPSLLGRVTSGERGAFHFAVSTRKLVPGEYVLRAWSASDFSAQTSDTYFNIEV